MIASNLSCPAAFLGSLPTASDDLSSIAMMWSAPLLLCDLKFFFVTGDGHYGTSSAELPGILDGIGIEAADARYADHLVRTQLVEF